MTTLFLDTTTWDLTVDADGNIAVASGLYATAQDVASAVRLFRGELWYDTTQGVPYFDRVLAKAVPLSFVATLVSAAAKTVPGVADAKCDLALTDRTVSGKITIANESGQTATVSAQLGSGSVPWYVSAVSPT